MKTLNREKTAAFFTNAEGYAKLKADWSHLMQDKTGRKHLTAAHHLLYLILRGKDWQRAFAPVANPVKLANGGLYNWGARKAVLALHSEAKEAALLAPFADLIGRDALCLVRTLVPTLRWDEHPLDREPYHE